MEKLYKYLSIILLLILSVMFNHCAPDQKTQVTPTYVEEAPKTINEIYFKDGKVIQCDIVWEGVESEICCKKSEDILAYSAADVNLVKTFGKTDGKEIAEGYEERVKQRELMSSPKIVTTEQERWMKEQESERGRRKIEELSKKYFWTDKHGEKHIVTKELIELEKRRLENKLLRTSGSSEFKEHIRNKIKELERDPAMYFYNKSEKPATIVVPPVIVHTW